MSKILDEESMTILTGAVNKRCERAEAAVLRDFFAQHGIEGEEAERAKQEYYECKEGKTDLTVMNAYLKGQYEAAKYFLEQMIEKGRC